MPYADSLRPTAGHGYSPWCWLANVYSCTQHSDFLALLRHIKNIIAHQHINNTILVKLSYFGVCLPKWWVQWSNMWPSWSKLSLQHAKLLLCIPHTARADVTHPTIMYICMYHYRYDHVPDCGDILFHGCILKYIWSYLDDNGAIFSVVLPKYGGWCRLSSMSMYSILLGYLLTPCNSFI